MTESRIFGVICQVFYQKNINIMELLRKCRCENEILRSKRVQKFNGFEFPRIHMIY